VKRIGLALCALLATAALVGAPAQAAHKKTHTVSCKEIKDAMAAGKTADDIEKDMKVSASRVKSCTTPSSKKKKSAAKAS
jgi:hypothetical protein